MQAFKSTANARACTAHDVSVGCQLGELVYVF